MLDFSRPFDVLVIGGGNAALCAAITAREGGRSVLVLEHAPKHFRGGNSRHTRNLRSMHIGPTSVLTDSYPEQEYWDDLLQVTGGQTDERLARHMIRNTTKTLLWLDARGVRFQRSFAGTLSLARTNAFFLGAGKALINALYAHAQRIGVEIAYDSEVTELKLDDGAVIEARVSSRGFPETVRARCYVASCGGFQANIDWLRQYWATPPTISVYAARPTLRDAS